MDRTKTARRWTFTAFETAPLNLDDVTNLVYAVYQHEIAPETKREHLQGYLHFKAPVRLSGLKKIPGLAKAHFEIALGSAEQNTEYCTKEASRKPGTAPVVVGKLTVTEQGRRNDIDALKEAVNSGASDLDLWNSHPRQFLAYRNSISAVRRLIATPRDFQTQLHVLIGPTATGKTSWVMKKSPKAYWKPRSTGPSCWWDGYDGVSDIVIDEFYGSIKWDEFLRLANCCPHQVEIKGGFVNFAPRRIFVTSNARPSDWWMKADIPDKSPLYRRITVMRIFSKSNGEYHIRKFKTSDKGNAYDQFNE